MLGVSSTASAGRRHRPGAAAAAYSLAFGVLGDELKATNIAITSLRRGAGSRLAVIAHARKEVIEQASATPPISLETAAAADLRDLAQQLARTRPALEQVLVDLELRFGLDSASFGRVLGVPATRAVELSRSTMNSWATQLDPAMMAWLGPGSCDDLSAILTEQSVWPRSPDAPMVSSVDSTGPIPLLRTGTEGPELETVLRPSPRLAPITVGALLETAPVVADHAATCDVCSPRLQLMTPVRSLVGQAPLEDVPPAVTSAAQSARRRLPAPLPPSVEPHRFDINRLRVPALGMAALVAVTAIVALFVSVSDNEPSQASRVAALVQAAPASRLLGTPTVVTPDVKTASLANNGAAAITWHATSNQPWLTLKPSSGKLQPSQSISIAINATPPATGITDAKITITGDDGSVQTLRYATDGG